METLTITDPIDVHRRLAQLNLNYAGIRHGVIVGDLARMGCTPNDPPTLPGLLGWGRTLRGVAEAFSVDGWTREDRYSFPVLVSPDRTMAIAVSTGDINTGNPALPSNTKYPREPRGQAAIRQNQQISLFPEMEEESQDAWVTWFLLVAKKGDDAIQCELKLPWSVGEDGRVEAWAERIILPMINPNEPIDFDAAKPEDDAPPNIDIEIARRK